MKFAFFFIFLVALVIFFLNRQRSQMTRLRGRRRFAPDWGKVRGGRRRRRGPRFGSLRSEMTRLEEENTARGAGESREEPDSEEPPPRTG